MRIQICALIVFGLTMWALVFMRLQGGFVEVRENVGKVVKGNKPTVVKGKESEVMKRMMRETQSSDYTKSTSKNIKSKVGNKKHRKYHDRETYNFHDIISGYAMKYYNAFPSVSDWTCDEILCEYFRIWRQKWNVNFQNYALDKQLLQGVIKTHIDTYSYELPSRDDIVMHIRLGDISRSACFDNVKNCIVSSGKFPYQFTGKCYEELFQWLPTGLTRIVLVSSDKWNTNKQRESSLYKQKIIRLLEGNGYSVVDRMNQYMDSDIAFMSHAKYFIGGGGGFSHMLKEQAILNNATVFDAWYPRVRGQKCIWTVHNPTRKPKKLDIFHVNHEKAVWRMRFEEHWDFVDEFHVFESSISHQGNPKILYFKENQDEFTKYASKIVYHEISSDFNSEPCKIKGNWICENHDRIEIAKTMREIIDDDDIIIFSDADEIIFSDVLAKLDKKPSLLPTRIRTPIYKYSFHWKQQQKDRLNHCIVARGAYVKQYSEWNALRRENDITAVIEHGGLSPSTFGSIDEIIMKSLHSRTKRILDRDEVMRRVNNGISLWDNNKHFVYKENIPFLPKLARTEPEYFKEHFMRYGKMECALLFFGLAKHFNDIVFPSIQTYILNNNKECDIYVHTYNITSVTNPRNKESHTKVNPMEVYSMTNNVVTDTLKSVEAHIDFEYYHRTYTQSGGAFPYSMDNTLKQWYSIQRVWDSMPKRYNRVGLFRLDTLYTEPVNINSGNAVIPDFHHWGGLNDRAFYGLYKWAKIWATDRLKKLSIRAKENNIYDMHAETFVKYLMRDVPIELKPFCFKRVRATGKIKNDDCKPIFKTPTTVDNNKIFRHLKYIRIDMPLVFNTNKKTRGLSSIAIKNQCQYMLINLKEMTNFPSRNYISSVDIFIHASKEQKSIVSKCLKEVSEQITVYFYSDKDKKQITNKYKASWEYPMKEYSLFLYLEHDQLLKYDFMLDWAKDNHLLEINGLADEGFVRTCVRYEFCNNKKYIVDSTSRQYLPKNIFETLSSENIVTRDKTHNMFRIRYKDNEHYFIGLNMPYCAVTILTDSRRQKWVKTYNFKQKSGYFKVQETSANNYILNKGQADWNMYHIGLVPISKNGELGGKIHHMPDKYCANPNTHFGKISVPFFEGFQKNKISYHSSRWEQLWLDNIERWQHHKICEALSEQTKQLRIFMKDTCSASTNTDWCLIDDSVHRVWYNTKNGQVSLQKPSSVTTISPLKKITPKDDSIWSYFELPDGTREYIEPLVSHLRHPLARCSFGDTFLTDRSYVLPGNPGRSKTFLFDAGASHWSQGAGGPSLSYFASVWKRYGFNWAHIEGWEGGTTMTKFYATVPQEWRSRTHFHQKWISTSPNKQPFVPDIIRSVASKEDYVVFKLDIDSKSVETSIVEYMLSHPDAISYIDEFVWEHHVNNYLMTANWGNTQDMSKTIADSYQYFIKLRKQGIRAHSWV